MNTIHTRATHVTAVVGAAIATAVAPALLLVSAGTAHAIPDLPNEPVCPDCGGFNPQPDSPGFPERAIIDGPIIDACVGDPDQINIDGCRNGLGGPDTAPN